MGTGIGIEHLNVILQVPLKPQSPLCPRWTEEQVFSFLLAVPVGCGDSLFVTGDHFLHVTAGHGRVWALWLWGGERGRAGRVTSGSDLGPHIIQTVI